eukprot:12903347-Prorocentrum_lima.AAC.1
MPASSRSASSGSDAQRPGFQPSSPTPTRCGKRPRTTRSSAGVGSSSMSSAMVAPSRKIGSSQLQWSSSR